MDSLTFLSIGQNNISSLGAKFIGNGLRNLRTLDIHNNSIDLEGVQAICKLTKLIFLNIGLNSIDDEQLESIIQLTELQHLNMALLHLKE